MKTDPGKPVRYALWLFLLIFCGTSGVYGGEDWQGFLRALGGRGYYDLAVDYLKGMRGSPECPAELAPEIDFRIAILTLESARTLTPQERVNALATGQKTIERFLGDSPKHPMAAEAYAALAHLLIDDGNEFLKQGEKAKEAAATSLRVSAREQFTKAKLFLDQAVTAALDRARTLKNAGKGDSDEARSANSFFLKTRIESASLGADLARTWNKESEHYTEGLTAAKKELHAIYEKYISYTGAFHARFLEGIVLDELGETNAAADMLAELVKTAAEPALASIRTQALLALGEIYIRHDRDEDEIRFVALFDEWKNSSAIRSEYYRSLQGIKIHLLAARLMLALAKNEQADHDKYREHLRAFFGDEKTALVKILMDPERVKAWIVEQLRFVRSERNSFSEEAGKLLADPMLADVSGKLRTGEENVSRTPAALPNSFNEAYDAAGQSWQVVAESVSNGNKPDAATVQRQARANTLLRGALSLVDPTVPADRVNTLRIDLASLCLLAKRNEESYVLANALCRMEKNPNAAKAARIALAALRQLHADAKPESRAVFDMRMEDLTNYIDTRWKSAKGGNEAAAVRDAMVMRIDTAVASGDFEKAERTLDAITDESAKADAQLQLGISLWHEYAKRLAAKDAQTDAKGGDLLLKSMLAKASTYLETGLNKKLARNEVQSENYFTVYCAHSLAQIALSRNDPASAIKWLTHPVIGPLNIVEHLLDAPDAKERAGANPFAAEDFQLATLITALRANVELEQFAEAQKIMTRLETIGGGATDKLLAIYVQLGRQIEAQLREVSDAAKAGNVDAQKKIKTVSAGFEQFLDRISARGGDSGYTTLRWVGDTYLSLARGIAGTLTDTPPEALEYYTKAGRTFNSILKQIAAKSDWAGKDPAMAKTATTLRLVECLRGTGRYDGAVRMLAPVLKEHENNLDLQVEGARVYQDWGRIDKEYYVRAIIGGERQQNGQNLIWGWNRIISRLARVVNNDERYKEMFYNACLDKLLCRYLYSRRLGNKEEAAKHAKEGEEEILRIYKTHPDLGGPAFRARFESQLKRFRQQQGIENPPGLESVTSVAEKNAS